MPGSRSKNTPAAKSREDPEDSKDSGGPKNSKDTFEW